MAKIVECVPNISEGRRKDVIEACLHLPDAFEDYPFDDPNWTAMRHKSNRKTFAFIFEKDDRTWINLKAEPLKAIFWHDAFASVVPAYHMNKRHWISVILDGNMEDADIAMLIAESYDLTAGKTKNVGTL